MRYFRRSRLLIVALITAAIGVAAAAIALADTGGSPAEQIKANPGPEAFLAADKVSASQAQAVFTLKNGQAVSVIDSGSSRCLLHRIGSHTVGRCFSEAKVDEGEAITVADECGTSGKNLMEITGLAPAGATGARLAYSDGSSQDATIVDGAFKFEGTNPGQGDPYPTSVSWSGPSSATTSSSALPVSAGQFCLPTS